MRELFVYYRLPAAQADTVKTVVDGFQARLRERFPGLAARLLRRPVAAGEPETWMEVYARPRAHERGVDGDDGDDDGNDAGPHVDPGVDDDIEAAIAAEAAALDGLIIGPRHVEVFAPCAS